jgi:hypothetical protein
MRGPPGAVWPTPQDTGQSRLQGTLKVLFQRVLRMVHHVIGEAGWPFRSLAVLVT